MANPKRRLGQREGERADNAVGDESGVANAGESDKKVVAVDVRPLADKRVQERGVSDSNTCSIRDTTCAAVQALVAATQSGQCEFG